MTLLQLKYVVTVAAAGTISEAAKQLYMTPPSLTSAIKELENELGINIFKRTNKGILLSAEGEEFLGYARHYSFAVEAFVELLKQYGGEEYDFRIRETQTYELIEDVAKLRSEVGVLYLNGFNETVLRRTLRENNLEFHRLFIAKPHVFMSRESTIPSTFLRKF